MRGMYLHAERLLAKAGRQGAMGRGISHPEQSGGRAQRRSAQAQRGRLLGNPCAAPGQRPQRGLVSLFVRASAQDFQGRVAAGTGRCGGKRRMRSSRSAGGNPPEKRRCRACLGLLWTQDCQLPGDVRRC